MESTYTWNIDLTGIIGSIVELETIEGHIRRGKVSGIDMKEQRVFGAAVRLPERLYLNNDLSDFVDWSFIKEIRLAQ